jgi:hypothetical protein
MGYNHENNAQQPTPNNQQPMAFSLGSWALDVVCWAFKSLNLTPMPRRAERQGTSAADQ